MEMIAMSVNIKKTMFFSFVLCGEDYSAINHNIQMQLINFVSHLYD